MNKDFLEWLQIQPTIVLEILNASKLNLERFYENKINIKLYKNIVPTKKVLQKHLEDQNWNDDYFIWQIIVQRDPDDEFNEDDLLEILLDDMCISSELFNLYWDHQ